MVAAGGAQGGRVAVVALVAMVAWGGTTGVVMVVVVALVAVMAAAAAARAMCRAGPHARRLAPHQLLGVYAPSHQAVETWQEPGCGRAQTPTWLWFLLHRCLPKGPTSR